MEKRFFKGVNLVIFVEVTQCEDCICHAAEVLGNLLSIRRVFKHVNVGEVVKGQITDLN